MNNVSQSQVSQRLVTENYIDLKGENQTRASGVDFDTLSLRHIAVVLNLPGFKEDKELTSRIVYSSTCYDKGEYDKTLNHLILSLDRMPALEPFIFYYIRVCKHVLSIPLTKEDVQYEAKQARYLALPKWLRWVMPGFVFRIRCKWCGRYTRYAHPDKPAFGIDTLSNSCLFCNRMYPMPSWLWDSPDGRAYSYYRMSFSGNEFYEEFERDYEPMPLCKHRQRQQ